MIPKLKILFTCVANSYRSQMVEAFAKHHAGVPLLVIYKILKLAAECGI